MRKSLASISAVVVIILLSSFTNKHPEEFIGTFSVSSSDPSQIQLTLNADHTYSYQDFSIPENKIEVAGTWAKKGKRIILNTPGSANAFHTVWTFSENGQIAKSHKGLTFYRLCKVDG